jgi:hypothetical protein
MRRLRSNAFHDNLATEAEDTSGKISHEIEYMFYARVTSPQTLLNAMSIEIQEQWGVWQDKTDKNAGSGSNRVRKVIHKPIISGQFDNINTTEQIVHTTKLKRSDGSSLEVSVESTEDALKAFRVLAESGMIKHRYRFPIPEMELVWEVDMFVEPGESMYSTKYIGWAKIDLEVPQKDFPVPVLPEGFTDGFNPKAEGLTEIQQKVVEQMQGFLSLPNPYIKEIYPDVIPK